MKTEKILQSFFENGEVDFLEECQLCHNFFSIYKVKMTLEGYFYCDKCDK